MSCGHRQTTYEVNDNVMYFIVEAKQFTDKLRKMCTSVIGSLDDYDLAVEDYEAMIRETRVMRNGAAHTVRSIIRRPKVD